MNIKTWHTLAIGSILTLSLLATGCSSGGTSSSESDFSDSETVSQTFPYSGQTLTIDTGTADLVLASGDGDGIQVGRQIAGAANGETPEVTETLDGDTLNLAVDCNGFAVGCKGRFTVTVPEGTSVIAQNKNSEISASDFAADLTVGAVNGNADLSQISSPNLALTGKDMEVTGTGLSTETISADTRNGDIDLSFTDVPTRLTVNGHDGNVRLALPDTEYRVDVTTKMGKDDVNVAKSDSSSSRISVSTRNGDVTIVQAS